MRNLKMKIHTKTIEQLLEKLEKIKKSSSLVIRSNLKKSWLLSVVIQ